MISKNNKNRSVMSNNPKKAQEYAFLCLDKKMYNYNGMLDKLIERGFDKEICLQVVNDLVKNKYIDDYDYAKRYAIDSVNFKKQGIRRIAYELQRKKTQPDVVDHVIEEIYPLTLIALDNIVRSRLGYLNSCNDLEIRKFQLFLNRKGFSYEDINSVTRKYRNMNIDDSENTFLE